MWKVGLGSRLLSVMGQHLGSKERVGGHTQVDGRGVFEIAGYFPHDERDDLWTEGDESVEFGN